MSAIGLWGYTHGLPAAKTLSLYREDVFEALGYMDYFDVCGHAILENYAQHDIDVRHIERFLTSRKVFMFGPLHPKFSVTLALCVGICEKMGVKPGYTFDLVDKMLPDPLVLEYAWREESLADRAAHEAHVKELFLAADVLVFTLGLTEAWVRHADGAVLPVAPGVVAGDCDPARYGFRNFTHDEIVADLSALLRRLGEVNPVCRVLLTVSPVPLAATYEARHVSVSSMASKAILRAAVESALAAFPHVDYFPSFEIFFTPGIGAGYFDPDARHVLPAGVAHAMRLFDRHYAGDHAAARPPEQLRQYARRVQAEYMNINCDEGKIG